MRGGDERWQIISVEGGEREKEREKKREKE